MKTVKIDLPFALPDKICALGGQTKNAVAFAEGSRAWVSPVHGDLGEAPACDAFEKDVRALLRRKPRIIACDLHPDYHSSLSARMLEEKGFKICRVQHHHAHIASCMAQRGLRRQKVIGVAFDGTGFGPDGTIWGAEFLVCDYAGYERAAHLREIPLIGGEAAIREPWRVAAALLEDAYGSAWTRLKIDFCKKIDMRAWRVLRRMRAAGLNVPQASSMGRLFDAAACLVLARTRAAREADTAIALQQTAARCAQPCRAYEFAVRRHNGVVVIDPLPSIKGLVEDIRAGRPPEATAFSFHLTVAAMTAATCRLLRAGSGLRTVALSGGVFQNTILLGLVTDLLYKEGFTVHARGALSPSDASLALGQLSVAAFQRT